MTKDEKLVQKILHGGSDANIDPLANGLRKLIYNEMAVKQRCTKLNK